MEPAEGRLALTVTRRRQLTPEITEFTLSRDDAGALPPFTPGAHIAVETPGGAMRSYSLINDGAAPETYVIAIKREPNSRGGSTSMHDAAPEGTALTVTPPENNFELVDAPSYLLVAGGIGVTPILSIARRLTDQGKPFNLIYCTRTPEETAFLDEVNGIDGSVVHHDHGEPDQFYDFWDHFADPGSEHVYCCGPSPLMEEIKAISGHWTEGRVHFENFNAVAAVRDDDEPFSVTIAGTGETVEVPADRSILESLRAAGVQTTSSCESGTCGTCKCRLVDGDVDHRDLVLLDEEKDRFIMICVSRAKTGDLVVDL